MKPTAPLTSTEAAQRLTSFGYNELPSAGPPSDIRLLMSQLKSPLVYVLVVASVITYFLSDPIDTAVIAGAVIVNTIFGFFQERKAQHALYSLKSITAPTAKVIRDHETTVIPARTLVPGDIVILAPGDRVPADGTLVESVRLLINEAIITGESVPVGKSLHDQPSVVMGTIVVSGRGKFVVEKTGLATQIGQIAKTLETTTEEQTPLQRQLRRLAKSLAILVVVLSGFLFLGGILVGEPMVTMFTTAVALAVSAIPEGMIVALTVILSVGMQRILKKRAAVRHLISAETLGSVTTLCIDKTGTLTEGVMRIERHEVPDNRLGAMAALFANNDEDPLERALWEWSERFVDSQQMIEEHPRIDEIPFETANKYMSVTNDLGTWVKGAPEILIQRAQLSAREQTMWIGKVTSFGKAGLRVLGLAYKPQSTDSAIRDLTFLGIVGVADPVRTGVTEALAHCDKAGISVKVVTGDYRVTAETILSRLGIPIMDPSREVMEGVELEKISTEELNRKIQEIRLFCRVTPLHKLKIVESLQSIGHVVAMTGDGVNDALAIKRADVGIVVADASDVARETADIVLLDSNFRTIVDAIEEGRGIFQNIRKVVLYLLSDAFTEMILIVGSLLLRLPLALAAAQILWINIISDGLPFLALSFEPKDADLMHRPPRNRTTPIVDAEMKVLIPLISVVTGSVALLVYLYALRSGVSLLYARTLVFTAVAIDTLIYVFSCRSLTQPVWRNHFAKNPALLMAVGGGFFLQLAAIYHPTLQRVFQVTPLAFGDWVLVAFVGLAAVVMIEIVKFIFLRRHWVT